MKIKLALLIVIVLFSASALADSIVTFNFDLSLENNSVITSNIPVRATSVLLQITTNKPSVCKYSNTPNIPYSAMSGVFDFNFEMIHKKTITDLTNGIYKFYIRCKDNSGNISPELEAIFAVDLPVSAQIILPENEVMKSGRVEVKLITSKIVSETPSLGYSFDGISYDPIPLIGSGTNWEGYLIISDSLDEEVGSFNFQARDLEGNLGSEITSGGIFLVDTLNPEVITDIKAEGFEGRIKLTWHTDNAQDIDKYKIYRSTAPNLDQADYYKSTSSDSFTDTSVEKGKTYYYKISAIDNAKNEGDLSHEVYATALLEDTIIAPSGLEARFLGVVDNFLSEIDSVIDTVETTKQNFINKGENEKKIYENLKLEREIDSSKSELNTLRKEINDFKSQSLTPSELDKKLNSGKLKLNTIKKRIPENIIVISEKTEPGEVNENDIMKTILKLSPDISEKTAEKKLKKSLNTIETSNFKVDRSAYNLEIVYLDGSRKRIALIKETLNKDLEQNKNLSIIETIPESITNNIQETNIKNVDYEILENIGFSFTSDTREIIYSLKEHINLDKINEIKTFILHETSDSQQAPIFTGYFTFINPNVIKNNFGILFGVLIISFLLVYLFLIKRKREQTEMLLPIIEKIAEAEEKIESKDLQTARDSYDSLSQEYKILGKKERKIIYKDLEKLHKKLNNHSKQ